MKTKQRLAWIATGDDPSQIHLCGEFNFDTVPEVYAQLLPKVQRDQVNSINLSQVTASNSAGLGMLLGLMKAAKQRGRTLTFVALPQTLMAIAAVTGVSHLLSMT